MNENLTSSSTFHQLEEEQEQGFTPKVEVEVENVQNNIEVTSTTTTTNITTNITNSTTVNNNTEENILLNNDNLIEQQQEEEEQIEEEEVTIQPIEEEEEKQNEKPITENNTFTSPNHSQQQQNQQETIKNNKTEKQKNEQKEQKNIHLNENQTNNEIFDENTTFHIHSLNNQLLQQLNASSNNSLNNNLNDNNLNNNTLNNNVSQNNNLNNSTTILHSIQCLIYWDYENISLPLSVVSNNNSENTFKKQQTTTSIFLKQLILKLEDEFNKMFNQQFSLQNNLQNNTLQNNNNQINIKVKVNTPFIKIYGDMYQIPKYRRTEFYQNGCHLLDVPHLGTAKKEVVDKMMITDVLMDLNFYSRPIFQFNHYNNCNSQLMMSPVLSTTTLPYLNNNLNNNGLQNNNGLNNLQNNNIYSSGMNSNSLPNTAIILLTGDQDFCHLLSRLKFMGIPSIVIIKQEQSKHGGTLGYNSDDILYSLEQDDNSILNGSNKGISSIGMIGGNRLLSFNTLLESSSAWIAYEEILDEAAKKFISERKKLMLLNGGANGGNSALDGGKANNNNNQLLLQGLQGSSSLTSSIVQQSTSTTTLMREERQVLGLNTTNNNNNNNRTITLSEYIEIIAPQVPRDLSKNDLKLVYFILLERGNLELGALSSRLNALNIKTKGLKKGLESWNSHLDVGGGLEMLRRGNGMYLIRLRSKKKVAALLPSHVLKPSVSGGGGGVSSSVSGGNVSGMMVNSGSNGNLMNLMMNQVSQPPVTTFTITELPKLKSKEEVMNLENLTTTTATATTTNSVTTNIVNNNNENIDVISVGSNTSEENYSQPKTPRNNSTVTSTSNTSLLSSSDNMSDILIQTNNNNEEQVTKGGLVKTGSSQLLSADMNSLLLKQQPNITTPPKKKVATTMLSPSKGNVTNLITTTASTTFQDYNNIEDNSPLLNNGEKPVKKKIKASDLVELENKIKSLSTKRMNYSTVKTMFSSLGFDAKHLQRKINRLSPHLVVETKSNGVEREIEYVEDKQMPVSNNASSSNGGGNKEAEGKEVKPQKATFSKLYTIIKKHCEKPPYEVDLSIIGGILKQRNMRMEGKMKLKDFLQLNDANQVLEFEKLHNSWIVRIKSMTSFVDVDDDY
ncbi:hypothetical protein ABK040_009020 [Willaertia magna]